MAESRYSVVRHLATGGMAEIFLARQQGAGGFAKKVVVKRVRREHLDNDDFVSMFLDEARIGALLSHRNVVQVFDFGEDDGTYFLAMEYLLGLDLSQLRKDATKKKQWLPVGVVVSAIADACAGLHHAHTATDDEGNALHLVHRDVSPSNLFVTFDGTVKVLDFGIAKAEGRTLETKTGVLKGKYFYMSPEQVRGETLTAQSDVFALGACLYELLTCVRPFGRDGELAVIRAILEDEISPPSKHRKGIPPALDAVILRALSRDVSVRYANASALRDALFEAVGALSTSDLLRDYLVELYGEHEIEARRQQDQAATASALGSPQPGAIALSAEQEPETAPSLVNARRRPDEGSAILRPASNKGIWIGAAAAACTVAVVVGLWFGGLFRPFESNSDEQPLLGSNSVPLLKPGPVVDAPSAGTGDVTAKPAPVAPNSADAPSHQGLAKSNASETAATLGDKDPTGKATTGEAKKDAAPTAAAQVATTDDAREKKATTTKPKRKTASTRKARYGSVDVNCIPWCKIFVDGRDTKRNSPAKGIKMRTGTRTLKLIHPPSGREQKRRVRVKDKGNPMVLVRF